MNKGYFNCPCCGSTEEEALCPECADKGIRIHAAGAMGHNEYRIEES